jgi:hypothetical protein
MLLATEQTIVPTVKITKAHNKTDFRPIMCENDAHDGWKTVEQSKKLVPHQKASMAVVPFKLVAIVLTNVKHGLNKKQYRSYWQCNRKYGGVNGTYQVEKC